MLDQLEHDTTAHAPLSPDAIHAEIRQRVSAIYTIPPFEDVYRCEGDLLAWHDVLALARPPMVPGRLSQLKAAFKIKLARALHWLFLRQVKFNHTIALHACESARVTAALDGNVLELFTTLKTLQREFDRLAERQRRSDARVAELEATLTALRLRLGRSAPADRDSARVPPGVDEFVLQNRLQGPRENVMQRLRAYLDYFRDAGKVLDVCCGRGELVELLEAEGVPVWGVDADPDMADYCHERGLPVGRADATESLDEQADGSLGGVFLGRIAERMPSAALVRLLRRCRAKLRPGGVLVVEAVNPTCPAALAGFMADPARIRPLPPDLLRFLLENEGFTVSETIASAPAVADLAPLARSPEGLPSRMSEYHTYAMAGRA
jgi:2-polyprenyl-3-methyl-5-hydroxy-6-metoxy-1,4-benzoquinol methylase